MLKHQLKQWAQWGLPAKPRLLEVFTDGKNHDVVLVESAGKHFVIKRFEHSFTQAIAAQRWAADRQLAPNVIYADNGLAVMEHVNVQTPQQVDIPSLAQALRTLHAAAVPAWGRFDLLAVCERYLYFATPPLRHWHTVLAPALTLFISDNTRWCACHNDLVQQNCLLDAGDANGRQAWLIDWEYAKLNNPWFDLASVVLYFELNDSDAQQFLADYYAGRNKPADPTLLIAAQIAVLWCDLLWHVQKDGIDYQPNNTPRFEQLRSLAKRLSIQLPA